MKNPDAESRRWLEQAQYDLKTSQWNAKGELFAPACFWAQQAAGKDAAPWVGLFVMLLTKGMAVASEEADKRSWQTLPDEIHVARAWIPAGQYQMSIRPSGQVMVLGKKEQSLNLVPGQTTFIIQRIMQ